MSADLKAKDILSQLPVRRVVGDRTRVRVGGRAWAAPPFAKGRKIFAKLGIPDPWEPDAPAGGSPELGSIALPTHREPKPHLMPKEQGKPSAPKLPNIPGMPPPQPKEAAAGRPAPRVGETRRDDTAELKAKLKEKERLATEALRAARSPGPPAPSVPVPVAKLPVRPDLDIAKAAGGSGGSAAGRPGMVPRPPAPPPRPAPPPQGAAPASSPPVARPPSPAPSGAARPTPRPPRLHSDTVRRSPATWGEAEEVEDLPPPAPPPPRSRADIADLFGTGGGGWDVRKFDNDRSTLEELPTPASESLPAQTSEHSDDAPRAHEEQASAPPPPTTELPPSFTESRSVFAPEPEPRRPVLSEIGSRNSEIGRRPASAGSPPPAPNRQPPPAPSRKPPSGSGGGMEDLFGGGGETRIRIPKPAEAAEAKPRRPMVSTPEEIAAQKLDRRPPPPKPPSVKATGGGGMADPEAGE